MNILLPHIANFTPPERTPWGGDEIKRRYKKQHGVTTQNIIGESWEISGHPSFPSIKTSLDPAILYGPKIKQMPFLAKFINSGSWKKYRSKLGLEHLNNQEIHEHLPDSPLHKEMLSKNLSIQVHPSKGASPKTEAWHIIDAEQGAGIYLGTKKDVTKEIFEKEMLAGNDLSYLLNFIEVKAGDTFFIPAGTLHAIGAGVLLFEIQETSETTYRAYDWNRLYNGKPRQLHFQETINATNWQTNLKDCFVGKYEDVLVDAEQFQLRQIKGTYKGDTKKTGITGVTVIQGSVIVNDIVVPHGCSAIIPYAVGEYTISGKNIHVLMSTAHKKEK
jgi:mannose-6-phosphate isomerase class I